MPETKAEDDDEEGFGDFKFASFPNRIVQSDQINGRNSTTDDDEWGDFIESPLGSVVASDLSHTKSAPSPSGPSKPFDPLEFFLDHSPKPSQSVGTRIESEKTQWVKPKGALPLSIFGDVENEKEQPGVVDPPFGVANGSSANKHVGMVSNGSNIYSGGGISDVIENLYSQNPQIKAENGSNSNSNGSNSNVGETHLNSKGINSKMNGFVMNLSGLNSNSNLVSGNKQFDHITDLYNQNQQVKAENLLNPNITVSPLALVGLDLNFNGLKPNSDSVGGIEEFDDDGWEFKDAFSESHIQHVNAKEHVASALLGLQVHSTIGKEMQVDGKGQVNAYSSVFGNGSLGSIDLLVASNGFSSKSSDVDIGYDSRPLSVTQTCFNLDSYFKSEQNWGENGLNSDLLIENKIGFAAPVVGNVESDKNFGDFKNAFSESGSKQEVDRMSLPNANLSGSGNSSHRSIDLLSLSNGFSIKSVEVDTSHDSKPVTVTQTGFDSDSYPKREQKYENGLTSDLLMKEENGFLSTPIVGNVESDEGFGDFKYAFSETGLNQEVDKKGQVNAYSSGFGNSSHGSFDLFATSNGFSRKSGELDIGHDSKPFTATQTGFGSDLYFKGEQYSNEKGPNSELLLEKENGFLSATIVSNVESDESFGDFKYAFSETGTKQEEEPKVEVFMADGKIQLDDPFHTLNEIRPENNKRPLPLSLFVDEELETVESLNSQDISLYKPTNSKDDIRIQVSNISINDLITNLYSQAEKTAALDSANNSTQSGLDSIGTVFECNIVIGDDDFDDGSWEFKDASSEISTKDRNSVLSLEEGYSGKLKLDNYVDFYCKLKDELCFIAKCHLNIIKKAQTTAAHSGEDVEVAALGEEIQEAYKELDQENKFFKEVDSEDQPPRDNCLKNFLEVLHEPRFQLLESEYQLSGRLLSAEKDLGSAIELMKHATSILNVLKLGSREEQSSYVSTWSKIIFICAQELKHGAWIWKQFVEENVQNSILSEPRVKRFILALGEIYRVAVVIGASVKVYKPWILSNSLDPTGIYPLLEECFTLWSSSGLEEALQSIPDPVDIEYDGTVKALLESIKYIHDIDALTLGKHVFSQQKIFCRLSLLTPGALPDMKTVAWNGEHYFLRLANLWANLISCNPPELPLTGWPTKRQVEET